MFFEKAGENETAYVKVQSVYRIVVHEENIPAVPIRREVSTKWELLEHFPCQLKK